MFRHNAIGNCRDPAPEDINACATKCGTYEMPTLLPPKKDQKACPRLLPSDRLNICCRCCDGTYTHSVSGTCSMCKGKGGIAEMFKHSRGSCKNPAPGEMNACLKKCETYEMPTIIPPDKDQKACPKFESKVGSAVDSIGAMAEVAVGEGHICCRCCDGTYTHSVSGSCSICKGKGGIGEMFRHNAIGNCRDPAPEDINACATKCGTYEMPTLLPPKKDQKACPRLLPSDRLNICCRCCDGTYTHSVSGTCSICKGKRGIAEMFKHPRGSSCKNPAPGEMNACVTKCETYEMPTIIPPDKDQKACPSFESKVGSAVDSIGAHVDTNTTIWIGCILLCIIILFTLKRHRKSGSDLSISFLPANELADLTTTL